VCSCGVNVVVPKVLEDVQADGASVSNTAEDGSKKIVKS